MAIRNCALYIRVSTPRQASVEEGSLKAQEARLKAYIDYENTNKGGDWEIVDIYREEGRSAKNLKRPEFQRLMSDVELGKINTIIIWKIDRLTRSLKDFSTLWEIFKDKGIQIISLNEKFDTSTAIGRAMINIILVFAQLEREQTGERTSATMLYRAESGLWNGGRVIGYDINPEEKGFLKINPEQIAIVKKAFDLCIEKGSAGQVQRALNEVGYRMPVYKSRRGNEHGDTLFTKQAVIRMLTNHVYIGKINWAGKLYQGKHEPVISEKKFQKVQQILQRNRKTRTNDRQPRQHVYILQGILRCGNCGSMMTSKSGINGSGHPYNYYQCTRNGHVGKLGCKAKYVPAKSIEDFVIARVKDLTTNQEEIEEIVCRANKCSDEKFKKLLEDKQNLAKTLQQIKDKLNTMVDTIEKEGAQAFKTLQERMAVLEKQREELENKLKTIEFETSKVEQEKISVEIMKQNFATFRDIVEKANPQRLKELLFNIIEVIEWYESTNDESSGHIKISYFEQPHLNMPENTKSEQGKSLFAQSDDWLPTLDSRRNWAKPSKCKEIRILVKMYRRRGRGTAISLYDPLPPLPQAPRPVYKNIVAMAVQVREYLIENPQRTQTAAGNHFGITRARVSQLMTIVEKIPDDFISIMKTTEDQSLLKRFSGKTLLRIAALSTPEQREAHITSIRSRA